jgi:hypothetical protein
MATVHCMHVIASPRYVARLARSSVPKYLRLIKYVVIGLGPFSGRDNTGIFRPRRAKEGGEHGHQGQSRSDHRRIGGNRIGDCPVALERRREARAQCSIDGQAREVVQRTPGVESLSSRHGRRGFSSRAGAKCSGQVRKSGYSGKQCRSGHERLSRDDWHRGI